MDVDRPETMVFTGGAVDVSVFGVDGRRVRTLVRGVRAAGEYTAGWNGADDAGHITPAGIYYARLSAPGLRMVRKLARLQ